MRSDQAKDLLDGVRDGTVSVEEAVRILRRLPFDDIDFARPDTHRELRQGFPEAIYAEGKTPDQVVAIARRLLEATSGPVLVTRTPPETAEIVMDEIPDAIHHAEARLVVLRASEAPAQDLGVVAVVTGGTSDLPVAEEAAVVAATLGARVERLTDVGVAGLHRLLAYQDLLHTADVVIVVAGMEGALASLVGGISSAPVVAVPTSVGYGAAFDGLAALLAMLNSCAAGIAVTNIDNGFGAAMFAARVLQGRKR
jgi:NCAIR mutase (PurE)-related protein